MTEAVKSKTTPKSSLPEKIQPAQPVIAKPVKRIKPIISVSKKAPAESVSVQTAESSREPGWTCQPGEKGQKWNCNLIGPNPEGKARIVETAERKFTMLEPAFNKMQEQIFTTLASQLKYDPWANCSVRIAPEPYFERKKQLRETSPLDITSNFAELFQNEISSYSGNVTMTRADQHSISNSAQYDTVTQTLDLHGDVYYTDDDQAVYANSSTLELAKNKAQIRNLLFIDPKTPLRGRASVAYRENKNLTRYKDVAYTACPPGDRDWVMHASAVKLNDLTGKGSAKNAWLEFKGLPVFYSPYMSFPIDDRRKSGFLAPSYGKSRLGGFNFSLPYYWNIAPNYDATFTPRYYTNRGVLFGSNFRFLNKYLNGNSIIDLMPHDNVRNISRYFLGLKNQSQFGSKISSNMNLNYVSDKYFFAELGSALSYPNFPYLKSTADLNYNDTGISLTGHLENYQNINTSLHNWQVPYRKLPQILFNYDHPFDSMPLDTAINSEFVYFEQTNKVSAQRVNFKPTMSFPLQSEWGYLTPRISVQHTDYRLSNQSISSFVSANNPTPPTIAQALPSYTWNTTSSFITRTLPILSLDSGLFFEKQLDFANSSLTHTIEPRLFYLYIPRKNQSNIPLYDSGLYDFWYATMFRENRFSGTDLIQDANQVTPALTTRLLDSVNGRERLKLSIGETFYFQNRNVTAPVILNFPSSINIPNSYLATPPDVYTMSPLVTELSSQFTENWSGESGLQWSPSTNAILKGKALLHFLNGSQQILNVGFFYRHDPNVKRILEYNQAVINYYNSNPNYNPLTDNTLLRSNDIVSNDVSIRQPLFADWNAISRVEYSWLYHNIQDAFVGLEKETCCWRFQVIARHNVNNVLSHYTSAYSQYSIFFQFELKGMGFLGEKLDPFFEQSIYGFQARKR